MPKIKDILLMEILDFNNIPTFDYKKISNDHYQFEVNKTEVDVNFDEFQFDISIFKVLPLIEPFNGKPLNNVGYKFGGVETQFKKTDVKEFLPILKTIVEIVKEYVQRYDPFLISIFATSRENVLNTDVTKLKIYKLLISKYHPEGYGISTIGLDGDEGILLYNTKKLNLIRRQKL